MKSNILNILKSAICSLFVCGCKTPSIKTITKLPKELNEASAIVYDENKKLFWTIQDSNNEAIIYGFDEKGNIKYTPILKGVENKDWEDLLIDAEGNLYIGDFGNNSFKRKDYFIYKIDASELKKNSVSSRRIIFDLEGKKERDFEAFILKDNTFYLFSKDKNKTVVYSLANQEGKQKAIKGTSFSFDEEGDNRVTSAALSPNEDMIILLNHSKLWKLTEFKNNDFFSGAVEIQQLNHKSQKEGICFKNNNTVFITDEYAEGKGGNLYELKIKP